MGKKKLTKKEVLKKRPDLEKAEYGYPLIPLIAEGILPIYWTSNFVLLLSNIANNISAVDPALIKKIKLAAEDQNFNLAKYQNKSYVVKDNEAHKGGFGFYKNLYKNRGVDVDTLLKGESLV